MAKVTRLTLDNSGELDRRRLNFREISGDADAPLESVGQDLRKARERKGEDLDHIARVLKIRHDYLVAIEESAMEALPGKAYAIGFVRSYATYLGLGGDEYVERLKAEIAGRDERETPAMVAPAIDPKLPPSGWVVGGLVAIALIYAGYYLLFSATRLTEQPVIPVPERLVAEAGLPPSEPLPATAAPQQTQVSTPVPATPTSAVTPQAAPAAVLPPGRQYGVQNTGSRITLRIHRASRVTVQGANDRIFINRALTPGDTYLVPNVAGLSLSTPDSGAVELIVDGNSVGFVGQNGVVANGLPLIPQALIDRQNRG